MNPSSFLFIHQGYKLIKGWIFPLVPHFANFDLSSCILTELHTHKKATFGVKKIYLQFFYSPSILYRLIKCPFPEKLASQNFLQNKDSGKTIKRRSNRRRKAKGRKRGREKGRYSLVRDVQILASMNAPKKLLN